MRAPLRLSGGVRTVASLTAAVLFGLVVGAIPAGAGISSGEKPVTITVTPERILDTRPAPYGPIGVDAAGPVGPKETLTVKVAGADPVPADATGVILNVTAVNSTAASFVTLYPAGAPRPNASTVNPDAGEIVFNAAVIDLRANGVLAIYNNSGRTDIVIDVTGYTTTHNHDDRYEPRITVVESDPIDETLGNGSETSLVATCPPGLQPIAGGADYNPSDLHVSSSFPTTVTVPGPSWVTRLKNDTGSSQNVTGVGYATCTG